MENKYDLIIVGAGPAGLTASLYAARYKINHLVIGDPFASKICEAHLLENWPGLKKITGLELIQRILEQVREYKVEIINEKVVEIKKENLFKVKLNSGQEFFAKSLIIATGMERRRLAIPGEKEFLGKGVSYCATCDAPFFKEKVIAVIGGANAALMAADLLSRYAKKVYLIYRGKEFRAEPIWQERI
ncbi:MAG: NAD(P)/FAD-dependent oxidoreductase, partial [Patescibacteria group bacterium]